MTSEVGRMQILERAAAEGYPAFPEQGGDVRVPTVEGEDVWQTWAGIASQADMRAASTLLEHHQKERWHEEDDARRREPPYDENLEREATAEARADFERHERERPRRMEETQIEILHTLRAITEALARR